MLQKFVKAFGGDPNKREVEKLSELVEVINGLEPDFESLSDEELRAKTDAFREQLKDATDGIEDDEQKFEIEQEISRFDVPVYDAGAMRGIECACHTGKHVGELHEV